MNRFVASCAETRELLSDYAEGDLERPARRRVVRHLLMCRRCRAVLRSLKSTIEGLNALGREELPADPKLVDAVSDRIRAERDEQP